MAKIIWISCCILVALATTSYAETVTATCSMVGTSAVSTEKISGTVTFTQENSSDTVTVTMSLDGFDTTDNRTEHGFHIHETGSTGSNCADAGSHFDGVTSGTNNHGAPNATNRHVGDLGNVPEVNGTVVHTLTDTVISLTSTDNGYIVGKAVVIHQDEDDLGLGSANDSTTTGNAGARIGCCVIMESAAPRDVTMNLTLVLSCIGLLISVIL